MYSTHNEGRFVVAEIKCINSYINTWLQKSKMCKCMTSLSKNVYIDKLDEIVDKYNNTYRIVKMNPVDVKPRVQRKVQNLKFVIM